MTELLAAFVAGMVVGALIYAVGVDVGRGRSPGRLDARKADAVLEKARRDGVKPGTILPLEDVLVEMVDKATVLVRAGLPLRERGQGKP